MRSSVACSYCASSTTHTEQTSTGSSPAARQIFAAHFGGDALRMQETADHVRFHRVARGVELFHQVNVRRIHSAAIRVRASDPRGPATCRPIGKPLGPVN